jgi:hypothetical protein
MQRRRYWWLPYIVLEFDKNEILVDALGGDLANPVWNYRADLWVVVTARGILYGSRVPNSLIAMSRAHQTFLFPPTFALHRA